VFQVTVTSNTVKSEDLNSKPPPISKLGNDGHCSHTQQLKGRSQRGRAAAAGIDLWENVVRASPNAIPKPLELPLFADAGVDVAGLNLSHLQIFIFWND
jgi:hypothetical protein